VDGLLGIGQAGGKQSQPNEGRMLADRLAAMRQERDARAKELVTLGSTGVVAPAAARSTSAATGSASQPQAGTNPGRPKSNGKKKKKNRK
jgi:hypothetical protein